MNGFHGTKWSCLHVMSVFVSNAENGYRTHSLCLRLHFHPLNAKGDIDVDAHTDVHTNANITCKQSLKKIVQLQSKRSSRCTVLRLRQLRCIQCRNDYSFDVNNVIMTTAFM